MTSARAISRKERGLPAIFPFLNTGGAAGKDDTRNARAAASFCHLARKQAGVRSLPCGVCAGVGRLNPAACFPPFGNSAYRGIRKFRARRAVLFSRPSLSLSFFLFAKSSFPVIRSISQCRPSFLQIATPRYRIGNFRNLSLPSDDLLPARTSAIRYPLTHYTVLRIRHRRDQ